jgi:hypothetical protein
MTLDDEGSATGQHHTGLLVKNITKLSHVTEKKNRQDLETRENVTEMNI